MATGCDRPLAWAPVSFDRQIRIKSRASYGYSNSGLLSIVRYVLHRTVEEFDNVCSQLKMSAEERVFRTEAFEGSSSGYFACDCTPEYYCTTGYCAKVRAYDDMTCTHPVRISKRTMERRSRVECYANRPMGRIVLSFRAIVRR